MLTNTEFLLMSHQIRRLYTQLLEPVMQSYGLTQIEIDVLLFLHNNPQYDTARDIAEYRMIAKSYISKAVDLLMQKGYIMILEDAADRRLCHLHVQPEAKAALDQAFAAQQRFAAILHKGFSPAERALFQETLSRIYHNVQEALSHD